MSINAKISDTVINEDGMAVEEQDEQTHSGSSDRRTAENKELYYVDTTILMF